MMSWIRTVGLSFAVAFAVTMVLGLLYIASVAPW
jgi:hypothetical protein